MALAPVPLRVGLVTSLDSAAHADMRRVLDGSGLAFKVFEADTPVQGADAPEAIAAAIRAVTGTGVDVVVLARGGGSRTDLVAFDHEIVARAIASCERPVFTGIGHETDRSVADETAHTACSTPTAAARAAVQAVKDWLERLDSTGRSIAVRGRRALAGAEHRTGQLAADNARGARAAARQAEHNLDAAAHRLAHTGRDGDGTGRTPSGRCHLPADPGRARRRAPEQEPPQPGLGPAVGGGSSRDPPRPAASGRRRHPGTDPRPDPDPAPGMVPDTPRRRDAGAVRAGRLARRWHRHPPPRRHVEQYDSALGATAARTETDEHRQAPQHRPQPHHRPQPTPPSLATRRQWPNSKQILQELEGEDPDVDVLANRVERAANAHRDLPAPHRQRQRPGRACRDRARVGRSDVIARPAEKAGPRHRRPAGSEHMTAARDNTVSPPAELTAIAARGSDSSRRDPDRRASRVGRVGSEPRRAARATWPTWSSAEANAYGPPTAIGDGCSAEATLAAKERSTPAAPWRSSHAFALAHDDVMDASPHPAGRAHRVAQVRAAPPGPGMARRGSALRRGGRGAGGRHGHGARRPHAGARVH